MSETTAARQFDEELNACPDCGEPLTYSDHMEFLGGGLATIRVACGECSFSATEEWVHDVTTTGRHET